MTGPALAWAFLTRIAGGVHPETDEDLGRAVPWLPWVGLIIGLAVWAVYGVATLLVPEALGAPLAILTGIALTGGLHEDGLADTFDGLGGHTPERRLEIMRDSRVGVFGVAAVVGSIVLRSTALALLSVGPALVALTAAHIVGRTSAVGVMLSATPARPDGIGAGYMGDLPRRPSQVSVALGIALVAAAGPATWVLAASGVAIAVMVPILLAPKFGGVTGDVLGAAEQMAEMAVLVAAVAVGAHGLSWLA